MVIPFSNANEALRAVELIGHDPAARDVSVVVVDFTGVIVDDAFGAAALEQIVETIDNWGAESIFASVSPLSEIVVAELERQPLYIHKDLAQAIAAGFQIANSQRSRA
jgi:anti-anti-sigma regulatory factor